MKNIAKHINTTQILEGLSMTPLYKDESVTIYRSPWKVASGKGILSIRDNHWHDTILRTGGNNIQLIARLKGIDEDDAADWIVSSFNDAIPSPITQSYTTIPREYVRVNRVEPVTSTNILTKLKRYRIDPEIVKRLCKEVAWSDTNKGTSGYGVGLENIQGGYGLYSNIGSPINVGAEASPTVIDHGTTHAILFVGLLDFLAYCSVEHIPEETTIILYSHNIMRPLLGHFSLDNITTISAVLPNTKAKENILKWFAEFYPTIDITDLSSLYPEHKNYHGWINAKNGD